MTDMATLLLALTAGGILGAFFFGGLWWTVREVTSARYPAPWVLGSFLVRTSITLLGFYLVSGGHSGRLLLCLIGFVAVRYVVTRMTSVAEEDEFRREQGARHAP